MEILWNHSLIERKFKLNIFCFSIIFAHWSSSFLIIIVYIYFETFNSYVSSIVIDLISIRLYILQLSMKNLLFARETSFSKPIYSDISSTFCI